MKKRLVSAFLILCFILSVFALSSCAKDDASTTAQATEPASSDT